MPISTELLTRFGLPTDSGPERLRAAIDALPDGWNRLFFSGDGRSEMISVAEVPATEEFEPIPLSYRPARWTYRRVNLGSDVVGELLEVPRQEETPNPPPTEGEKMLVRLFSRQESMFTEVSQGGFLLASWIPARLTREIKDTLLASLGAATEPLMVSLSPPWQESVDIVLDPSGPFAQRGALAGVKLMKRAFLQKEPRWKFLTLYQVLEHGFLLSILNTLNSQFLMSPIPAIDDATEALKHDLRKFVELIRAHSLNEAFKDLETNFKTINTSNRFAAALERQWGRQGSQVPSNHKGAFICYKIRCAIVHAGDALTYDAYVDADAAVISLLGPLEKAVIKYAGITFA